MITEITPEQEALIPIYRAKWLKIALSTERIDRDTTQAIKAVYSTIGKQKPEVIFCDSPYAAWKKAIQLRLNSRLNSEIENKLLRQLASQFNTKVEWKLYDEIAKRMSLKIDLQRETVYPLEAKLKSELKTELQLYTNLRNPWIIPQQWSVWGSLSNYYFSVLNCAEDQKKWSAFESLCKECGWILPYEKICIVSFRPTKLSFDSQNLLHAQGEPAIQFADGYSLYSYHGLTLPEKYGKIHPNQWQAQWLLEEDNVELRRVLIQGIGYARICQELQATQLDCWKEYILLRIDADIDGFDREEKEPVHLLKMTCPSTGYVHAMRVPPEINSAREAIVWVNWGIDPEEFAVQT